MKPYEAQVLTEGGAMFDQTFTGATLVHTLELDLFSINRIRPGRTQVVQDELVNHG